MHVFWQFLSLGALLFEDMFAVSTAVVVSGTANFFQGKLGFGIPRSTRVKQNVNQITVRKQF